jgi:hypothetical protein
MFSLGGFTQKQITQALSKQERYPQHRHRSEPSDLLITVSGDIKKALMAEWKRRPPPQWRTLRLNTLLGR